MDKVGQVGGSPNPFVAYALCQLIMISGAETARQAPNLPCTQLYYRQESHELHPPTELIYRGLGFEWREDHFEIKSSDLSMDHILDCAYAGIYCCPSTVPDQNIPVAAQNTANSVDSGGTANGSVESPAPARVEFSQAEMAEIRRQYEAALRTRPDHDYAFKMVAKICHPDKPGGSHAAMLYLEQVREDTKEAEEQQRWAEERRRLAEERRRRQAAEEAAKEAASQESERRDEERERRLFAELARLEAVVDEVYAARFVNRNAQADMNPAAQVNTNPAAQADDQDGGAPVADPNAAQPLEAARAAASDEEPNAPLGGSLTGLASAQGSSDDDGRARLREERKRRSMEGHNLQISGASFTDSRDSEGFTPKIARVEKETCLVDATWNGVMLDDLSSGASHAKLVSHAIPDLGNVRQASWDSMNKALRDTGLPQYHLEDATDRFSNKKGGVLFHVLNAECGIFLVRLRMQIDGKPPRFHIVCWSATHQKLIDNGGQRPLDIFTEDKAGPKAVGRAFRQLFGKHKVLKNIGSYSFDVTHVRELQRNGLPCH